MVAQNSRSKMKIDLSNTCHEKYCFGNKEISTKRCAICDKDIVFWEISTILELSMTYIYEVLLAQILIVVTKSAN